jgi:hypothetical protein
VASMLWGAALPGVVWIVILVGAFISLCASFFFKVEDVRLHGILVTHFWRHSWGWRSGQAQKR